MVSTSPSHSGVQPYLSNFLDTFGTDSALSSLLCIDAGLLHQPASPVSASLPENPCELHDHTGREKHVRLEEESVVEEYLQTISIV